MIPKGITSTLDVATCLSKYNPRTTFYVQCKGADTKVTASAVKAMRRHLGGWTLYCKIRNGIIIRREVRP